MHDADSTGRAQAQQDPPPPDTISIKLGENTFTAAAWNIRDVLPLFELWIRAQGQGPILTQATRDLSGAEADLKQATDAAQP
jgi:hypothetical protein